MRDKVIKQVVDKFSQRSEVGYKKYGVTLHDDEPNLHKWLNHLQEELMDAVNYIQKLQNESINALEQKLVDDMLEELNEDDSFFDPNGLSAHPEPGPPHGFGTQTITRTMYPGDVITYQYAEAKK